MILGSPNKKGGSPMEKKWGAFPPFPSTSFGQTEETAGTGRKVFFSYVKINVGILGTDRENSLRLREMRGKPPKIMLHYFFVTLVTR